ncbi:MAG TPA: Pr6Pr family membrane protein, partial [Acidimicrobiia bacterium]|nr:Pr6Pr family membrane protein [Acidimicrobiia bacterium]
MSKTSIARVWYAAIAVQVLIAISIRGVLSWQDINGEFSTPIGRVVNMFCYFTIQSNILVGVVALLLAINTKRDSTRFFVAQLTGLVCVLVAGVVYHILLASEEHLEGLTVLTNFVVHTSAP